MLSPAALRKVVEKGETLSRREETLVRVARMLPYLRMRRSLKRDFRMVFTFRVPGRFLGKFVKSLASVSLRPEIVLEKLAKEINLGQMLKQFSSPLLVDLQVSPLGLVPKKEPNKFRLIHHLSYPEGGSLNVGIDPEL